MYERESWTIKAEHRRIDAFKLWCWKRLLRVPWTARRSNQSILKEINFEYSLQGLMLKLQYFGNLMQELTGKDPDAGKDWRQEKGVTEDETDGWHHQLSGHKFEQTPGDGEGQGGLVSCSRRDHRVGHNWTTEQQERNSCLACLVRRGAEDVATSHVNLMLNGSVQFWWQNLGLFLNE